MMLIAASHIREPPYLAVTVGPSSHSPPPMAEALRTTPGPSMAKMSRQVARGTSIRLPVVQRGIAWEPGCGATKSGGADFACSASGGANCCVMERRVGEGRRARDDAAARLVCRSSRGDTIVLITLAGMPLLVQQVRRERRLGRAVQ